MVDSRAVLCCRDKLVVLTVDDSELTAGVSFDWMEDAVADDTVADLEDLLEYSMVEDVRLP